MNHPVELYFDIEELICPHVSARFGDNAWQFFDPRLLDTVWTIRKYINLPMYVNSWAAGGTLSQRGLRCNVCALVKEKTMLEKVYMTAHMQGEGVDFHVQGMSANETRLWIVQNQVLLPHPIRMEVGFNPHGLSEEEIREKITHDTMTWVHIDVRSDGKKRITYFQG